MKKFLFIGEKRSPRAIKMRVTWKDKRLAAATLARALEGCGINWQECAFANIYEDPISKIKQFRGIKIAMGRKALAEMHKHKIGCYHIIHPAARGRIRATANYNRHVREQLWDLNTAYHAVFEAPAGILAKKEKR